MASSSKGQTHLVELHSFFPTVSLNVVSLGNSRDATLNTNIVERGSSNVNFRGQETISEALYKLWAMSFQELVYVDTRVVAATDGLVYSEDGGDGGDGTNAPQNIHDAFT
jgi:hypothetical protein